MSSSLKITLNKPYIDSVREIFSNPEDIFKTVGSRFNINKIEFGNTSYEQNDGYGNYNDAYSYTMVILKQNSEDIIDIAIICQFNKNILGEEYDYDNIFPKNNDIVCQALYNEKNNEYYIYRPDNNYGVGKLLKTRYDKEKSNNDVLFKVFIIKDVPMEGEEIFSITIDGKKFATIDRFDIVKKDVSPATPATSSDLNKLDKSLFLLLYYINFHSFNVRFFSQLNNKFFGMTTGGITTAEPLQLPPESQQKTPVEQEVAVESQPPVKQRSERIRKAITTTYPITGIGIGSNENEEYVIEEPDEEEAEKAKRIKEEAEKAKRIKAEVEAEAEAKRKKVEAEAEAKRKKVEAEAEAKRKKVEAEAEIEAKRKKAEAEKEAEENNYKLEDIGENEKDDDPFDPNIYNPDTKGLIKYLFKKYKGTSEQKFINLLKFHPDDKPITKEDFIGLFDKTSKKYADSWFNAEFPNKDNKDKDKLLDAIKKYRYKVIYNNVAGEKKKEEEYKKKQLELEAKRKEEELQKKKEKAKKLRQKQEEEAAKKAAEEAAKKAVKEAEEKRLDFLQALLKQKEKEKEEAEAKKKEEAERQKQEEAEAKKKEEAERLKQQKEAARQVDEILREEKEKILEENIMREDSAKKRAQERDEDLKMAKRLNVKRENENKIELQKIRVREAEERKNALPEEKKPIYRYRMETVLDIKPDEGKKK